jgi:hypothetical protein
MLFILWKKGKNAPVNSASYNPVKPGLKPKQVEI